MRFVEGRLLGVQIDKTGKKACISILDVNGIQFTVELHGVERLLLDGFRQQNVVDDLVHWSRATPDAALREAAFLLMTGKSEKGCEAQLAAAANGLVDKVACGELEMMEITAIFGAQVLASFTSMTVQKA